MLHVMSGRNPYSYRHRVKKMFSYVINWLFSVHYTKVWMEYRYQQNLHYINCRR